MLGDGGGGGDVHGVGCGREEGGGCCAGEERHGCREVAAEGEGGAVQEESAAAGFGI